MVIFVDSSALYALLDADDANHAAAARAWQTWLHEETSFLATNYVLVEVTALVQRRLGSAAVRELHESIVPVLQVEWVDATAHELAMRTMIASGHRGVSLVDAVSFDVMRRRGIPAAFTFDRHFEDERFERLP